MKSYGLSKPVVILFVLIPRNVGFKILVYGNSSFVKVLERKGNIALLAAVGNF
jgi:hypothetical protein